MRYFLHCLFNRAIKIKDIRYSGRLFFTAIDKKHNEESRCVQFVTHKDIQIDFSKPVPFHSKECDQIAKEKGVCAAIPLKYAMPFSTPTRPFDPNYEVFLIFLRADRKTRVDDQILYLSDIDLMSMVKLSKMQQIIAYFVLSKQLKKKGLSIKKLLQETDRP